MALDPRIDRGENWLLRRIHQVTRRDVWAQVNAGVTDQDSRRDRIAQVIVDAGLEPAIAGKGPSGSAETFGQAFQRLYGRPVVTDELQFGAAR